MAIDGIIYLDNDYYVSIGPVNATTVPSGVETLQTGLTDVVAFLSGDNDFDDPAINGALSIVLTENGSSGVYRGAFEGSNISTYLALLVNQTIYLHIKRQQDFHVVQTLQVMDSRPA